MTSHIYFLLFLTLFYECSKGLRLQRPNRDGTGERLVSPVRSQWDMILNKTWRWPKDDILLCQKGRGKRPEASV